VAKVVLHNAGFRALRTRKDVDDLVFAEAEKLADAAGSGVEAVQTENPRNRARSAIVGPARKQDAMLRALGSRGRS
jgi:hypothetical protein